MSSFEGQRSWFLVAAATVLFFVVIPAAQAETMDGFKRRKVVALLENRRHEPTLQDWERIGPQANRILCDIVEDRRVRRSIRYRAIESLAWFPSKRTRAVLTSFMHARRAEDGERRLALQSLAHGFGPELFEYVRSFLTSEDVALREGAIRGLGLIGGSRALAALIHHVGLEKDLKLRVITDGVIGELTAPSPVRKRAP